MDKHQMHRAVISAAGFVFALIGFSLSVLSVLFALFMPARQQTQVLTAIKPLPVSNTPEKPPGRRLHVSVKHSSEISSSSSSAPSTPKELENLVPEVTITTLDIDSKSSPPIMHQRDQHTEIITQPQSTRKPTSITFTQPIATLATSSRVTVPESTFTTSEESRPGFRLSHLRPPWGDKRQNIYRSVSSPHLTTNPVLPLPLPENQPKPKPSALDKKQSMKTLRKAPSVLSNPHTVSCPVVLAVPKVVDKKRSQTLRTQPYEAPYFLPPPIPEVPRRRKPIRSRTLPPRHRSPAPKPGIDAPEKILLSGASLVPPSDYHIAHRR